MWKVFKKITIELVQTKFTQKQDYNSSKNKVLTVEKKTWSNKNALK